MKATSWQAHTVPGFISILGKKAARRSNPIRGWTASGPTRSSSRSRSSVPRRRSRFRSTMLSCKCFFPGARLERGSADSQSDFSLRAAFPAVSGKRGGEYSSRQTIPARLGRPARLLRVRHA
jgi:hypothetical protein